MRQFWQYNKGIPIPKCTRFLAGGLGAKPPKKHRLLAYGEQEKKKKV
jgi:hypothetical protein